MVDSSSNQNIGFWGGGGGFSLTTAGTVALAIVALGAYWILNRRENHYHPPVSINFHLPSIDEEQRMIMEDVEYKAYAARPGGQLSTNAMRNNIRHGVGAMYDELRRKRNGLTQSIKELNEQARSRIITPTQAQMQVAALINNHQAYVQSRSNYILQNLGVPAIS